MIQRCRDGAVAMAVLSLMPLMTAAAEDRLSGWFIQGGYYVIDPNVDPAPVAGVPGSSAELSSDGAPGLSLSYVFNDHMSVECFFVMPFDHEVTARGSLAQAGQLATLKSTFPTLIAQYSFGGHGNKVRPFVGVGVTYMFPFDEEPTPSLIALLGEGADLDVDPALTWIVQAGLEWRLSRNWSAIAESAFLKVDADARLSGPVGALTNEISLDIWAFAGTIAYRF